MKRLFYGFACSFCVLSTAAAGSFTDDFSAGMRPQFWSMIDSSPGVYGFNDTLGDVRLTKIAPIQTNLQKIGGDLNMWEFGGTIAGDFSTSIDIRDAVLGTGRVDQIEFQTWFDDGSVFFESFSDEYPEFNWGARGVHVWNGSFSGGFGLSSAVNAGTMAISRTGSTLSASFNGTPVFSETNTAALAGISFVLQNNLYSDDQISVTFDNFNLEGTNVVPEPASLAVLGLGAVLLRRRGRKS